MRDLRRQALESHKTVSRKAASKVSSRASSAAGSRTSSHASSRNVSRHGSDEDEEDLSDSTNWSCNSIDDLLAGTLDEDSTNTEHWKATLSTRIEEILDRKRSSTSGRELAYAVYIHLLITHYAFDTVNPRAPDLLAAFLKSIKTPSSDKEAHLALRAISITLITCPSDNAYDVALPTIKRAYTTSPSETTKATALATLSTLLIYGGASDSAIEETLDDLLAVIETDGAELDAHDSIPVVTAALQTWGFLATSIDDLSERSEAAVEAFLEQLASSAAAVQVAAGENIALLYEKSYSDREEDDAAPTMAETEDEEGFPLDTSMVKRYDVYHRTDQLLHELQQLASVSSKAISRKDRRTLHSSFADILCTVEHPQRGPRYQKAIDQETGLRYGSRLTIKVHGGGKMVVDRWWKLVRLQELRRVLGGGFVVHYEYNEVVFESLPIVMSLQS